MVSYNQSRKKVEKVVVDGVPGEWESVNIFGVRTGASTSVNEDIWEGVATTRPVPSAATPVEVKSTSAQDSAAGTGVRTLEIVYLDSLGYKKSTVVSMDGLTP